jgi:D-amino-acid oxidase
MYSCRELSITSDPWYAKHMQDYKDISGDELPTPTRGHAFTSFAINPEKYLEYLQSRAKSAGALFITTNLPTNTGFASSIKATVTHADLQSNSSFVVVNCTGLSASQFCGDENVFPIRGQTLLVRFASPLAREITLWEAKDAVTYVVPRPGTDMFIFGGTKDSTNVDTLPTPSVSEDIQNRCQKLLGRKIEGGEIEIIAEQVGFRPGRKGGVRIEVEDVDVNQGRPVRVVHNYGHAGAGYQASIGSAIKVLKLVQDMHAV